MILLLAACGSPHDTRPPRTVADEVRVVTALASPAVPAGVVVRATVRAVDHPPRTGGWENTEVGPMPRFPEGEWMEAWVEVRAWTPGLTPVIIERPEPAGYLLVSGAMRRDQAVARADQAAATVTHCWSADQQRLALRADAGGSAGAWVVYDFAGTPRIGQFWGADGACADALTREPLTWHTTQRE